MIGIATTCLAETIGEDVAYHLREIRKTVTGPWPEIVHVATPSYAGTHAEGFHAAIRAIVDTFAEGGPRENAVNLLPGIVSPADLRYLKSILRDFGVEPIVLSDYSDTLDGPTWSEYQRIPQGGTPLADHPPHGPRHGHHRVRLDGRPGQDRRRAAPGAVRRAELLPCRSPSAWCRPTASSTP